MKVPGTGMILSEDGHIITNHHVIGNASDIQVSLLDGRTFPAEVIGKDSLKRSGHSENTGRQLQTIVFGDSTIYDQVTRS
ncbi:MAG: hypothetical protein CM1200mP3_08020 [Chloroflexota bacterium]|nr:MAG: hypothetical protein CM1200mP3_08020 [Chloroflexota bacterium]